MTLFAKLLDAQEIAALAAYYQELQTASPVLTQSK
jgi:cytochrome c553